MCRSATSSERRPRAGRAFGRECEADRDRGAVAPLVALGVLDRVAQRVPVVEDLAQALLGEVLADDVGLHPDGQLDHATELGRGRVGRDIRVGLDDVEDLGVADAGLHDLGEPGEDLVLRQRVEQLEVAQHRGRRVEDAHEVLALVRVDAGLAADRGVDHAEHVVGTWTMRTPRSQVAATKPARSVIAPPPSPTITSVRVKSAWPRICQQNAATSTRLACSASGTSASSTS